MSEDSAPWLHPEFPRGAKEMTGIALGIGAWGLVTGVAMVKSGLGLWLSVLMSVLVFAGSAQLAAVPLIVAGAPIWVVWATALCINLRFVIFSAQWRVHMGHLSRGRRLAIGYLLADLNLIAFQRAWPGGRREPGQVRYIVGGIATIWVTWQLPSLLGIFLSEAIPTQWGLGFAGTLAMLGLTYGLLSDRSTWTAAVVAARSCAATIGGPCPTESASISRPPSPTRTTRRASTPCTRSSARTSSRAGTGCRATGHAS